MQTQIDFKLQVIQEKIDNIADAIYMQNAIRSKQLKACGFNIGCVRADLERAASAESQPAIIQQALCQNVEIAAHKPGANIPPMHERVKGNASA